MSDTEAPDENAQIVQELKNIARWFYECEGDYNQEMMHVTLGVQLIEQLQAENAALKQKVEDLEYECMEIAERNQP